MTEEACPARQRPGEVVYDWPVDHLPGLEFDPLLHRLLREEPVARVKMRFGEGDAWLVTRYEDVKIVAADPRMSRALTVDRPVTSMTPHVVAPAGGIGRTDPPDHTRLRRLVAQTFGRKRVEALRPRARELAERMTGRMLEQGPPADLAEHLTGPLPAQLIGDLLGVPSHDIDRLQAWRGVILSSSHSQQESDAVKREIADYFRGMARHRTEHPGDDLFSALVAEQADGGLSMPELISLAVMLVLNGMDAVRNQVSNMVYALLTHPEQLEKLRAEPSLLPQAVEELLRFIPHRNGVGLPRIATGELEVGEAVIRDGDVVYVSYLAANRDSTVFTEPDRLDLSRDEAPNLSFGHGAHYCVGAMLTRMEAEVMLATLLERFPRLRLAVGHDQMRWRRGSINRGPEELWVTW
ncbi:cytochrome P450 [Streptomyces griseocarneus]|uniref:cytochrome P450 n=1 Tax=Streptomyces griseocarneus TaxID=51201 RepID=UPI00167CB4C6|nr:cytochrome P450 [Streptomyces griseocarneus]MBZ6474310.1 cytochrome P450 [Streptomyces griseocarneus]GHG53235.1 biflaviolin synthase CYP158A2 [Streptomyces griseocarneus]